MIYSNEHVLWGFRSARDFAGEHPRSWGENYVKWPLIGSFFLFAAKAIIIVERY